MNTYLIKVAGYDQPCTGFGATPAKAKYNAYMNHFDDIYTDGFPGFIGSVESVKLLHKFWVSDLFTRDIEGFNRVCTYRGIPFAKIGMEVHVGNRRGVICGANSSSNLDVCFDGDAFVSNCHPGWNMAFESQNMKMLW